MVVLTSYFGEYSNDSILNSWVLALFFSLTWVILRYSAQLEHVPLRDVFALRSSWRKMNQQRHFNLPALVVYLLCFFHVSWSVYTIILLLLKRYQANFYYTWENYPFLICFMVCISLVIYVFLYYLILSLVSWLFEYSNGTNLSIQALTGFRRMTAFLFIINPVLYYTNVKYKETIVVSVLCGFLILVLLQHWWNLLLKSSSQKLPFIFIFLYICTLEVLPLLVIRHLLFEKDLIEFFFKISVS